uniref:DNA2/NAM7 helicase helicase domain-containing protein n=1 Tax=Meloidogyne floridensis TaxID=298350 RepID=A0A915NG48_9BILA
MLVGANYILPAFVSFALGDERRVHQPTTIVKAELETTQYVFPFNRQLEWSQILLGEKVISAEISAEIDKIRKDQQKYTVIVEPEIVRTLGPNQVVGRFTHKLNTKTELVEMAKWYEEDSSVSCSVTEKARPCAHVELILAHQESKDEDNWSFWEDFRNGEIVAVQFVPLQSTTALVKRMEIFAENLLSDSARSGTMNGKLIKMLLGKADRPEPPALRANQIGRGVNLINRLGDEQARTAELLLDDVPRVVFAQAPPGTGKTYTAASIMAAILERDPEARISSKLSIAAAILERDPEARKKTPQHCRHQACGRDGQGHGQLHNSRRFGREWAGSVLPSAFSDVQHAQPEEDAHNWGPLALAWTVLSSTWMLPMELARQHSRLALAWTVLSSTWMLPMELARQHSRSATDLSMSSYNPGQTWTALRILWRLFNVLPPDSSILCICLYGTQANDIEREVLAEEELNRSVGNYSRRNTRPRSRRNGIEKFLAEAKQKTTIVGQDYLDVIRIEGAQHNQEGELMDATGKSVCSTSYYAEEGRRNVSRGGYHRYNPYFYRNEEFPQLDAGP